MLSTESFKTFRPNFSQSRYAFLKPEKNGDLYLLFIYLLVHFKVDVQNYFLLDK